MLKRLKLKMLTPRITFVLCGLLVGAMATSGCETLRKKFIRQKKKDAMESTQFVPVLEPEEYPEVVSTSIDMYKTHYSLWQVWEKDLRAAIAEQETDKRQRYLLEQVMVQLETMRQLLVPAKQKDFEAVLKTLRSVSAELARPRPIRSYPKIRQGLDSAAKRVRNEYKFGNVKDFIVAQTSDESK